MKRLLAEGMIKHKEAKGEGLALQVWKKNGVAFITLYEPTDMYNALVDAVNMSVWKDGKYDWYGAKLMDWEHMIMKSQSASTAIEKTVRGYIQIGTRSKDQVYMSAAKNRYGPLMYEIAMSVNRKGIGPDSSVSKSARNVWKKFYQRKDIWREPDIAYHKEPYLNYVYGLKRPLNYNTLAQRHSSMIKDLMGLGKLTNMSLSKEECESIISYAGESLFGSMYE